MITTQISFQHSATGMQSSANNRRVNHGANLAAGVATVTSSTTLDIGTVTTPRECLLRNLGPDVCRFGFDGSTWPLGLDAGDVMQLNLGAPIEIQTVTPIAATTAQAGHYFTLAGSSGAWAVWLYVGSGSAPGGYGQTLRVDLLDGDTAATVASKLYAAMIASADFAADFAATLLGNVVTIADNSSGTRTTATAGTSGYTVATTATGSASPIVHAASDGTSAIQYAIGEF